MFRTILTTAVAITLAVTPALAQGPVLAKPSAPPPAPAAAPPQQNPVNDYGQSNYLLAVGTRCNWFTPVEVKAIEATIFEKLSAITHMMDPAALPVAQAQAAQARESAKAFTCSGADGEKGKAQAKGTATNLIVLWATRADALLNASTPNWAYQLTTLDAQKPALAATVARAQAANPQAYPPLKAQMAAEAAKTLPLLCQSRKTVRFIKGERPCPPVAEADRRLIPYAKAVVEQAEAFAPVFAAAFPPPPTPQQQAAAAAAAVFPTPVTSTGYVVFVDASTAKALDSDKASRTFGGEPVGPSKFYCSAGTVVFDLKTAREISKTEAGAELEATVRIVGKPGEHGKVRVFRPKLDIMASLSKPESQAPKPLSVDAAAKAAGVDLVLTPQARWCPPPLPQLAAGDRIDTYYKWVPLRDFPSFSADCRHGDIGFKGETVATPNKAATVSLVAIGSPERKGSASVLYDSAGGAMLTLPDADAQKLGVSGLGKFLRCS